MKLEILGGTKTEKEFQCLKSRFDALYAVETDPLLWEEAYGLAFKLRRKGVTVPYTDILVAACAIKAEAVVLHADTHFDLMKKHVGLSVESCVRAARKRSRQVL